MADSCDLLHGSSTSPSHAAPHLSRNSLPPLHLHRHLSLTPEHGRGGTVRRGERWRPWTAAYYTLPAACLLTGRSIFPDDVSYYDAVLLILLLSSVAATAALELRWSRVTPRAWWRDQQLWAVTGTSACLAAVFQGVLRACAGVDVGFSASAETATRSASDDEERRPLRWSNLLIPPASLLLANLAGVVVAVSYGVDHGYRSWGPVLGKLALAGWVVAHLQGFLRGLLARRDRAPTVAVLWSVLFVSVLSLLWVNVDSYSAPPARAASQQPVL